MTPTINAICTIEEVKDNRMIVEVIPNNLKDNQPQFYYLNTNKKIEYTNFNDFNSKIKEIINRNNTIYITFCGISNKEEDIPEYLYLVFSGNEINYKGNDGYKIYLEFNFKKAGQSLQNELENLFTNNVGVFIQGYL